jgi:IclR family KDG regulon transcriptional repressor
MKSSDPATTALKAIDAIELLADTQAGVGLSEVARKLSSSRTSALRILNALERKHLVAKNPTTKRYRLTLRLLELGTQVLDHLELPEIAKPYLLGLSQRSGEAANLGVLEDWHVVFIGKAESPSPIRLRAHVGARDPSHCTSLGKVLVSGLPLELLDEYLAAYVFERFTEHTITAPSAFAEHLDLVRKRGYAVDTEEYRVGVMCVGGPIYDLTGNIVAAVSVSGPAFRMKGRKTTVLARLVMDTAKQISTELGWRERDKVAN